MQPYSKTLDSSPGMFTSLREVQAYIKKCEQKRLDLDNEEVWSKVYLPPTRTTEVRGNYEDKVVFKHVQIRLVASNEPLMGCEPLPDWLGKKRCIYGIDKFYDTFCVWRCLAIYKWNAIQRGTEFVTKTALSLAREYYGDKNLTKMDVMSTNLVNFEGIERHYNVNIMLYEPKKDKGKVAASIWRLVYGKIQHKNDLPPINMGLLRDHCFYIKKMDVFCKQEECKGCR